jgi:hypothetical protein
MNSSFIANKKGTVTRNGGYGAAAAFLNED